MGAGETTTAVAVAAETIAAAVVPTTGVATIAEGGVVAVTTAVATTGVAVAAALTTGASMIAVGEVAGGTIPA